MKPHGDCDEFLAQRARVTKLINPVQDHIKAGYSMEHVRSALVAGGHQSCDVDEAIDAVTNSETGTLKQLSVVSGAESDPEEKPVVILPHGPQSISATGQTLGNLLSHTQRFFIRGGTVVKLAKELDGLPRLDVVKPATLASDFESVAKLCTVGQHHPNPAICSEQTAKMIATSSTFLEVMPPINVLTRCPVLIERAGNLMQVVGYDRESGIYAAGTHAVPLDVPEAICLLNEVLDGFRFATPADRARALAAIITPALVFGGLLPGRAPIDLGEADECQTGKGFRNKLTAAIYNHSVKAVAQKKSGIGSIEESFNAALIKGANFISLDNVKGKMDFPAFESFMTEDNYTARAAFLPNTDIDPRRVCVMLTSNKADLTDDLAKRSSCVRILKQAEGYEFKSYPDGDILGHIRANQARFLGAVFTIIKAWYAAGRPRTRDCRHDFRPWAQILDWITINLLNAGPLLDGHKETQARMTSPVLNWLRDVAIEVIRAKQEGAWLKTGDIVGLISETIIETPGLPEHGDLANYETRKTVLQATGRKLGLCFKNGNTLPIDGMTIERHLFYDPEIRDDVKEYRFLSAAMVPSAIAATSDEISEIDPETLGSPPPEYVETTRCGYDCGYGAANDAADKTLIAANAADITLQEKYLNTLNDAKGVHIDTMDSISRITATSVMEEGEI